MFISSFALFPCRGEQRRGSAVDDARCPLPCRGSSMLLRCLLTHRGTSEHLHGRWLPCGIVLRDRRQRSKSRRRASRERSSYPKISLFFQNGIEVACKLATLLSGRLLNESVDLRLQRNHSPGAVSVGARPFSWYRKVLSFKEPTDEGVMSGLFMYDNEQNTFNN